LFTNKCKVRFKTKSLFCENFISIFFCFLDEQHQQEEAGYDYGSVIGQLGTRINVRYDNSYMEEGDAFVSGKSNISNSTFP